MNKIAIPSSANCFFAYEHFQHKKKNIFFILPDEETTIKAYKNIQFLAKRALLDSIIYFPSLDTIPYDRISPNQDIMAQRSAVLSKLSTTSSPRLIITSAVNLLTKLPPPEVFSRSTATIKIGDKINIEELTVFLIDNGFSRSGSAIDGGEFAIRGEILDIVAGYQKGYRINFGWNVIESIKEFDINSQITTNNVDNFTISVASETMLNSTTIANFKNNFLKYFGVNNSNSPLYQSIIEGKKFHGYEQLSPLFFNKLACLTDYLPDSSIIYNNFSVQSIIEYHNSYNDFYESRLISNKANPTSFYFALPPESFIVDSGRFKNSLIEGNNICLENGNDMDIKAIEKISVTALKEKKSIFDALFDVIIQHKNRIPVILCNSKSGLERIRAVAVAHEYIAEKITTLSKARVNVINLALAPLSSGFLTDVYIFIAEQDILGDKFSTQSHKTSKRKLQNLLRELDNITEGELVTHKDHGIGRFEKTEVISVNDTAHDCLKIIYADNDILYVPVENIELITKYGNENTALDKLGGVNWQKRKAKLKNRIKDIAKDLIKITAKRQLTKTNPIDFDTETYDLFCRNFPYNETEDQLTSINDIKDDLQGGKLMDRLICGDVGFGKTEVAMRAAFMIVFDTRSDRSQVVVISPTTILCKQHFENFITRFKGFDLKIVQLSRLLKPAAAKQVKEDIENGSADIIIGTHALLAKNIKFKNLKLIIIDEEQHFGVSQKEYLKNLKSQAHVLSLSATPIPRTLQMSMVGIKDLSLIATPPIDRLPVRTTISPMDYVIIRDALMRERFRGGRSFYVCPRIKDMEVVEKLLREYVPELKYKIAHGQMQANVIDTIMSEFCDGKFDILLSTTIIESGIDISTANTMIIHRADMLGLSQLYQLRGRVGRGKVRGYAYLTLAQKGITSKHSMERLMILQNIDSLGAGFTIAGHDMDLRGFGNLVGEEQSGHIREVGSELYQQMLDEAITEIKENKSNEILDYTPNINLGIPVFIPITYLEDSSLRIAIYRRAGALKNDSEIEAFRDEMIDRFGNLPQEFSNLLEIVKIKNRCIESKIESIDAGPNGFVIKFNINFDAAKIVFAFVNKHPRITKIRPDNKLVLVKKLTPDYMLSDANNLLNELQELNL
jgi:transcription-repair coupling factor (superfamily II helicase)